MEEYPSPDAATMVVHEEDDPEHSFPFRDYSVCKDDKIWTEVIIDISTAASFQLRNKFETVIASAPCPRKWVVFHEPTLISDLPYFGAHYPSEDITEHLLIITQLQSMHLCDKFSYTDISVIDARHDIIGPHVADSAPIPVLDMKDIILH